MANQTKIRCTVVSMPTETVSMPNATQPRFRPSDLLPWADPYIASLVHKLQNEVREERRDSRLRQRLSAQPAFSSHVDEDALTAV
ncbi:hypothetical protein Pla175_42110 [Pirellulimonas nuda]|uniref:Uncharacterized protein n=1 Tax=Pirellulimonas nuda TaxID=2528009 RepID=A0A518DH45_9BACT|nr:hypothetical protein [Pirellulimonas nuda]QDU90798.1 hypothetical protein Pla175_42110 [Pirellulimonas nuda]